VVGDQVNKDAAWYYPPRKDAAKQIKDYIAFWQRRHGRAVNTLFIFTQPFLPPRSGGKPPHSRLRGMRGPSGSDGQYADAICR
jgi:hypothetical protein